MTKAPLKALIVQGDCSVLLEVRSPGAEDARAAIAPFAELVKSPEHVHTYRITTLSIWNARAAGFDAEEMVSALQEHARYGVPPNVEQEILDLAGRYGRVVIDRDGEALRCSCCDEMTAEVFIAKSRYRNGHLRCAATNARRRKRSTGPAPKRAAVE